MLSLDPSKKIDGVYFLSEKAAGSFDESTYAQVRRKEGRLYPDSIVKKLPKISKDHPLYDEWEVRKKSCNKISKYISNKKYKTILEVGCGNGWLTHNIAVKCRCFAVGVDLNQEELKQAARVFGNNEKIRFIYGNILEDIFPNKFFDLIIFAASIQYFQDVNSTISSVFRFLKPAGEIHIIDTNFYDKDELENARKRTRDYYNKLGFSVMAENYFHHTWSELKSFNYRILIDKFYIITKIYGKIRKAGKQFFPWIVITK